VARLASVEVDVQKLRDLRRRRVLTLEELAQKAGVGRNTVWRLEHGVMGAQPRTIRKLAKALGVEPEELVTSEAGAGGGGA
jgi:transcriptional regulator with XRE-family HTH domain